MNSLNWMPWLVLGGIVFAVSAWKGYIPTIFGGIWAKTQQIEANSLVSLGSEALGIAFAKAKRLEAEQIIENKAIADAHAALEAVFTNPFSPAGPAPAPPPPVPPAHP